MSDANVTPVQPVIEMRGVSAGALRDMSAIVVEDVNWSVTAGAFWVIGGLQGAGKSDFLAMTGGLTAPAGGTYRFLGEEMPIFEEQRLPQRLRLGLVFDGGQLFNHLTVSENVALPLRYHRNLSRAEAEPELKQMLEITELEPWADSTPGAIGRNWQQRVGLARALMLRPELLLLDNPLAGLDVKHRGWWLNFLDQLSAGHDWMKGRPTTLAVTTDDLLPWRKSARQFAILKNRHLIVFGPWEKLETTGRELMREFMAVGTQVTSSDK